MIKSNKTKQYYEKNVQHWLDNKTNSFHHEKEFTIFTKYVPKKAHIIDIGCAGAIHVPLFLGIGRHLKYTGMDITSAFLKTARSRYPQLTFIQGDISDQTTLPKMKFDGFWAAAVLMHIPFAKWDSTFKNIERFTKAGGIGYVTFPTEHPSGPNQASNTRHFSLLTTKEQKDYIKSRGWKILKSGTMDGTYKKSIWHWYIVQLPK